MTDTVWGVIVGIVYVAIIYTLVKPASKGPTIISNVSSALADLVKGTTGYTTNG